jgi:general secretion pathway protein I
LKRGFTLLELLVATAIMAVAVAGVMSALSTSVRNAGKLTDSDRAAMLARRKMEELLAQRILPRNVVLEGLWDPQTTGGVQTGWRARVTAFEAPGGPAPGTPVLDRVELEIWWESANGRRTFTMDAFRRSVLTPQDALGGGLVRQ